MQPVVDLTLLTPFRAIRQHQALLYQLLHLLHQPSQPRLITDARPQCPPLSGPHQQLHRPPYQEL
jgi:hypothetical protein